MARLTARKVATLTEPGRYSDGDGSGFHLRIDGEGRKYWVLRVQDAKGRRDVSIGSAAKLSLSDAREKARIKRDEIEAKASGAYAPTFDEAARMAHAALTEGYKNPRHVAIWLQTLDDYASPTIGSRRIDELTRGDVVAVLSPIWMTKPETARRVLQRIDRVVRWAVGNSYRDERIDMTLVRDALPRQQRKRAVVRHMPSLPWPELPTFWTALQSSGSALRLGLALQILTAVRPGNIRSARRGQVDLVGKVWAIPPDAMKAGVLHRVPLSDEAVAVLTEAMSLHDRDLIFGVSDEPITVDTLRMTMRRMGWAETPHGFRSTFKEWARAHGWAEHLSEAALAHKDQNEVRAAYARADLLEERRPMMQAWAAYLAGSASSDAANPPEQGSADQA